MSDQAVVIWGEVLWDQFPDGARLGGAPANVAWHLGQAGGWARLVTRVGDDDAGRRAIAQLEEHVDTSLIQTDRERATGEVLVRVEHGEPSYTLVPGRAWERIACDDAARAAIAEAGVLVYGTLAQRTREGMAGWRDAIAAAPRGCIKVYDLNLRKTSHADESEAIAAGIAAADVIKLNDRELAALGLPIDKLRAGKRVVALTHGARGSTLYADREIAIAPHTARAGGDNVGTGDAYLALLVHGMTLGWELAECGRAASRWAAAVAGSRGATPSFSETQIAELLDG